MVVANVLYEKSMFLKTIELRYNGTSRDLCYFSVIKGLCGGLTFKL